ncbi:hypothetical protein QBC38DRAFT_281606 [Podospora fimiseda]|uniref:Transcription initiation factor TFIID subunit 4 n=1 Tax=Podospora fimiseda TaxID=252190 RepID=A0AAN7BJZ5_9PEZI|nr:hypothetical protein QBC38DRAFT_281606 [Podospora fimiseda]
MAQPQPHLPQVQPQINQVAHQGHQAHQVSHMQHQMGMQQHHQQMPQQISQMQQQQRQQQHPQYSNSGFVMSPQATAPSPGPLASPSYTNLAAPTPPPTQNYTNQYNVNGHTTQSPVQTPTLPMPETRPSHPPTPTPSTPMTPSLPNQHQPVQQQQQAQPQPQQQYTNAMMAPITPLPPPPTPGAMLPPSKPLKEVEYDVADTLAGTGIDLRAEEQYLAELYGGSFSQEARTGLAANAPGSKGSFYGAGPANGPAETTNLSQEAFEIEAARKAWVDAAHRLAVVRASEIRNPFLVVPIVHARAEKIAKEYGLNLNLDLRNQHPAGKMRPPTEFPAPTVTVKTTITKDGAIVSTAGSLIPHDAYLVDQLALLSIATKHRLRDLLEDANITAITRQTTAHGEIPTEWSDVAVPLRTGLDSLPADTAEGESAKRSFDSFNAGQKSTPKDPSLSKDINAAWRLDAKRERDIEEQRLRKRQKRLNPDAAQTASRAGSAAPGTPSAAAPEVEPKAPTKKELKKGAARAALEASTANVTTTVTSFLGMGKKKRKEYSWMTSGSGPSTPRASGAQDPGTPSSAGGAKGGIPEKTTLTQDGKIRLGTWREDKEKGKNIQLRDWITVLERDSHDKKAIQDIYDKLDLSTPK